MNANYSATTTDLLLLAPSEKMASQESALRGAEVLSLDCARPGFRARVLEGMLWITQEGDPADYLIGPSEVFTSTRRGRIVVQSLTPSSRFVPGEALV